MPNNSARNVPDVALAASSDFDPYVICLLTNGAISQPGLGNINPVLYGLAGIVPQAFHDIVTVTTW